MAVVQYNSKGHSGSEFQKRIFGNENSSTQIVEMNRKRKCAKNARARQLKPKQRRVDDTQKTKTRGYGNGHEELDKSPHEFEICKAIFVERMREQQANRQSIERNTVRQKHSVLWKQIKQNLLTTSDFGRVINAHGPKSYQNILEDILYKDTDSSKAKAIRHQRMYEQDAFNTFKIIHRGLLTTCGIFIDEEYYFLGGTPFMLYKNDSIVSIKCPYKAFRSTFEHAISKNWIPFWKVQTREVIINVKDHWYIEIQGLLHISKRKYCYLMVWLGVEVYKIEIVERDDDYWTTKMKSKLVYFYEAAMLKELVDPRKRRSMELRVYDEITKSFQ